MNDKTLGECSREFSEAVRKLALIIAYELKIDKVMDWLTRLLSGRRGL